MVCEIKSWSVDGVWWSSSVQVQLLLSDRYKVFAKVDEAWSMNTVHIKNFLRNIEIKAAILLKYLCWVYGTKIHTACSANTKKQKNPLYWLLWITEFWIWGWCPISIDFSLTKKRIDFMSTEEFPVSSFLFLFYFLKSKNFQY